MKISVINGSPKGAASNTNVLVEAFLNGAREAGAETVNVFLSEYEIRHCRGCFACWLHTPGKCIINDDMSKVLDILNISDTRADDVFVLATPLYYDNISGLLKNFMDRLVVLGDPHFNKTASGESRHLKTQDAPLLMLISNCGFPEHSHFQVISHWIERAALNMHTKVAGKILTTQGGLLQTKPGENQLGAVRDYLENVRLAGREIVEQKEISDSTAAALEKSFIPDEIYINEANKYFDSVRVKK